MSITVQLPPNTEAALREKARLQGTTPEVFLAHLTQEWVRHNGELAAKRPYKELSTEEWIAELRAWAASHKPVQHFVDDSRESIYAGRGE